MRIVTIVTIDLSLAKTRALMTDPAQTKEWMHDLASSEPAPDGKTRMTFKNGMVFTVSPLPSSDSNELHTKLEGKNLTITSTARFIPLGSDKTELYFAQDFAFKGPAKLLRFILRPGARKQQKQHIKDFKRFAERHRKV